MNLLKRSSNCFRHKLWISVGIASLIVSGGCAKPVEHISLRDAQSWFIWLNFNPERRTDLNFTGRFDMGVIDPDVHPPLTLFPPPFLPIAYVSVGEAESYRSYWSKIAGKSWIIGENPDWPENYYVDVRSQEWAEILLETVIPNIIADGFAGIMMDTLDTAGFLEDKDPQQYGGSKEAMVNLIKNIKEKFPDILILSNNGFAILPEISEYVDGFIVEDIFMMIDFERNSYAPVSEEDREYKLGILTPLARRTGKPAFNIEYVAAADRPAKENVIKNSLASGLIPYIAQKDLDRIYE